MGNPGYLWVPMGTHGYLWVPMGCPWVPMDTWGPISTHQYPWVPISTIGYPKVPTRFGAHEKVKMGLNKSCARHMAELQRGSYVVCFVGRTKEQVDDEDLYVGYT